MRAEAIRKVKMVKNFEYFFPLKQTTPPEIHQNKNITNNHQRENLILILKN
jgi:hypothetical protein